MKVADYIINTLADLGINRIFLVYGSAVGNLVDAFTRTDKTRYVCGMTEQFCGFAAEGYAKIKGKPGVAIATSGPGGGNLVTPIQNCFYDSVPCLFITGQINSKFLRPDPSIRQIGFQETDIVSIVSPITKYAKMVTKPEDIRYELEKALFICQDRRPGPVLLDLPLDVQAAEIEPDKLMGFCSELARPSWNLPLVKEQIGRYIGDLKTSERPVLIVGGGVRSAGAVEDFFDVANILGIPCFPTWNALDVIPSGYRFYGGRIGTYGGAGRNFGVQNCDLLLAIGSRISGRITGGNVTSFARKAKKYIVDVDAAMLQPKLQQLPFDENILCDAKTFCQWLSSFLLSDAKRLPDFAPWMCRVKSWKEKYDPVKPEFFQQEAIHPYAFMRTLSEKMGPSDVFVGDCGGNIVVANHAFETKWGQRYITNNGNSPMGFSMCGAIGAWFADPSRRVVCVIGDGGMNMNIQELQTIVNYGVKIKIFILNNHIYGITKQYQEVNFEGRAEACGPKGYSPPDFLRVADAYHIAAVSIGGNSSTAYIAKSLEDGIDVVLNYDGPIICDVDCDEYHTYEPKISSWNSGIEEQTPSLPEDEFLANMIVPPLDGWRERRGNSK